jgi:hypothetical protein
MHRNSPIERYGFSRPLPEPIVLAPAETKQVSGGGANVRHGNPGGGSASYNTPGNPDYGQTRPTPGAGGGDE